MTLNFTELKQRIARAKHVVVVTGAGASAESGVPTFRDTLTGLWEKYDPSELAMPSAFIKDKALVWGWYEWRRKMLLEAQPNAGHHAIAKLEQQAQKFTLITQNVDDLHERAGSKNILHLHGSIFKPRCFDCHRPYQFTAAPTLVAEQKLAPPVCEHCDGDIRPGVVWFMESLPVDELNQACAAAKNCDFLLSVGTSGMVYPAAGIPAIAAAQGALVIHINPEAKQTSGKDNEIAIQGKAGEVLPLLV